MIFTIISHTPHRIINGKIYAYAPYVREMNIWAKYVEKLVLVVPCHTGGEITPIMEAYTHEAIEVLPIPSIAFTSFARAVKSLFLIPLIVWKH